MPQGLTYHLTEIWLAELDKASAAATAQNPVPLKLVLETFLSLAAKTPNKATYQQIQANFIEPLLSALSPPSDSDELPKPKRPKTSHAEDYPHLLANCSLVPSDESLDKGQLRKGILEYIFEVASQEDTKDSNRRKLYAICKANIDEDDDL
jgi:ribosomal RNA-processing protein 1